MVCSEAGRNCQILSVKDNTTLNVIKNILKKDIHAHGRGIPFPELSVFFARKAIYTPYNDTLGQKWRTRLVRRFVFNRYDKICVQTEYGRGLLIKEGIRADKVAVMPMPVDYEYFSKASGGEVFRKKHNLGKDPFVITVGIRPMKRPDIIAKACEAAGIKAVLVGPYKKSDLKKTWKGTGFDWYLPPKEILEMENVVLTGQLTGKSMLQALDAATIYAHSSVYEGFGIAVYEGAATGLPMCLPSYGTFDAFRGAALFHDYDDHKKLARNIKRYLDTPGLMEKNGKKSRQIAAKFDYPIVRKKYVDLYKSVGIDAA